jgi:acetyl-CoA carboxylase alpha subunit
MSSTLRRALIRHLGELTSLPAELLLEQRLARIAAFGIYSETPL